jgi:putative oxidoreductase
MKTALFLRWLLGLVFLVAGFLKLVHPGDFLAELVTYRVPSPEIFLRLVAVSLPWLEILCGGFLLLDLWPESVRPVTTVLCLVFVIMLGQAVVRGLDLSCGCFGRFGPAWLERPHVALVRALLLLAASAWLASVGARAAGVSHQ